MLPSHLPVVASLLALCSSLLGRAGGAVAPDPALARSGEVVKGGHVRVVAGRRDLAAGGVEILP